MAVSEAVKYKRGDVKACSICGIHFNVKHPQWCDTCSRKCGAVLRNKRTKIVRWVKEMQSRVQQHHAAHTHVCKQCNQRRAKRNQRCERCKQLISDRSVWRLSAMIRDLLKRRERKCPDCNQYAQFWATRCNDCRKIRRAEMSRHNKHVRRAKVRGAKVGERVLLSKLVKRDGMRCHWCGEQTTREVGHKNKATIDHVIALAQGGEHSMANCVVACSQCNIHKGTKRYTLF